MSLRTDRVRMVVLVRRKEGISREEFARYWVGQHSQLFAGLAVTKKNILKYEQGHVDSDMERSLGAIGGEPYDCFSFVEAESFEKMAAVLSDEEFLNTIPQDEEKWLDRSATRFFPLNIATVLDQ
ncbi:hypothetical protein PLICRDRAFT_45648 [Plicaturopsis crispa FD-325 SS-3]|uniref:Unplaced genomic scaffold PLICRscaffold_16, whole genome shotgun sequence n=1 Tax=Plicaturopsis crispa FD-325 SS-3 TaxID=944288 RepID=A0A0C9SL44_PLICR|nr:hypothetical protein PLICRDRAFT_45648 [Plicaturopsis crispa FD-325 SS-3]